ncbi:MAG: C25 family cysteine peptidase [Thermoplasmatales archaeon]|nr:C25 family cysteine peptidase [Thermoplasmatales archaeon]
MGKGVKKIIAVVIVIIIIATAYYIWQKGKGYETGTATLDDLLKSKSERKIGSTTVIASDENPYYALIGTPVALYYEKQEEFLSPLLVEGEETDNFLAVYNPGVTFTLEGGVEEASVNAAKHFWKSSDGAVLLKDDAYDIGLSIVSLASYLDIPVIVTDNTNNVLDVLKSLNVKYTIVCSELSGYGKTWKIGSAKEAQEFLLNFVQKKFGNISYVTVANPNDVGLGHGLPKLSCLAPYLSAGRKGIVVSSNTSVLPEDAFIDFNDREEEIAAMANNVSVKIKENIDNLLEGISGRGMLEGYLRNPYLAILGGPYSLPFYYKYVTLGDDKRWIATDDYFANLDEDEFTVELACGRPIALSVNATSCLISRSLCYDEYKEKYNEGPGATSTNDVAGTEWKSAAYVGSGDDWNGAIWSMRPEHREARTYLLENDYFVYTTKRRLTGEHVAQQLLELYTSSSMIYVMAHGSPSGYQMVDGITGADVQEWGFLGPSVLLLVSCSAGRTDVEDIQGTISLSFMSVGTNTYIAGTRTEFTEGSPKINFACLKAIVSEDATTGLAFRDAKNDFVKEYVETGKSDYYHAAIKQLYGDPAFNPYEPKND